MSKVKIINNTISNNVNSRTGIYSNDAIRVAGSFIATNNNIDGYYSGYGIVSYGDAIISNNKINLNGAGPTSAISVLNSDSPSLIENNYIGGATVIGIQCHSNSASINNNKIFATSSFGIVSTSSGTVNIIGNDVRKFNSVGVKFNGGNLQSNLISRNNSQTVDAFVQRENTSYTNSALVVDNIFSHSSVDTSGSNTILVKDAASSWIVERNLPTYKLLIEDNINSIIDNSAPTPTPTSNDSPATYLPIVADSNHLLWYSCNWNAYKNSGNEIPSDLAITPNWPNSNLSISNGYSIPGSTPVITEADGILGSAPNNKVFFAGVSYASSGIIDLGIYDFQSSGLTLEIGIKQRAIHNQKVTLVQLINWLPSGLRRRVSFNVNNDGAKFAGINWIYNKSNDSDEGTNHELNFPFVNSFDRTHLMMTMRYIAGEAELCIYINGQQVFNSNTSYNLDLYPSVLSSLKYFFLNADNNFSFEKMKIYLGSGLFSSQENSNKRFRGGFSDIRLSNTVRDHRYASRAYKDLLLV